jgi:hypothetical protein
VIPAFNELGYLPTGLHLATLDEIANRFGEASELRRVQMDSIRWMIELAKRAGVQRIVLNGSFVTDIIEPNDVDCVLLAGPDFPMNAAAEKELLEGLPFLDISFADQPDFDYFVGRFFARDRVNQKKGMIEVMP